MKHMLEKMYKNNNKKIVTRGVTKEIHVAK